MTTETKPTDFGTGEDSRTVPAAKLEIGVRVSGFKDEAAPVIVQDVSVVHTGRDARRIKVELANFNNGDVYNMFFRPDKPITTWGKL